jgi:hypothetical protein
MPRKTVFLGLFAALGLLAQGPGGPRPGGPGGRGLGFGGGFGGAREFEHPVTGQPYSGTRTFVRQQSLTDGTTITQQAQTQIYRDSQGRVREERTVTTPGGQTRTQVTISDPVAGVVHNLDVASKVSYDSPLRRPPGNANGGGRGRGARPATPATTNPNVKNESLGLQMMSGVAATGTRITRTIPAGSEGNSQAIQTLRERWISAYLQVPLLEKSSDPRTGTTTNTLGNISRGDPDPGLFQVPTGFTTQKGGPGPRRRGGNPAAQ